MNNLYKIKNCLTLFFIFVFCFPPVKSQETVIVHYNRCDGLYGDYNSNDFNDFWGIHVWDDALNPTVWSQPIKPTGTDDFGVIFEIEMEVMPIELNFIIHRGDVKDLVADQSLNISTSGQEVWIISGDDGGTGNYIFYSSYLEASNSSEFCNPEHIAIIHYHRCAGDYGDYSSNDFNDYWGLHVWADAANYTNWPEPLKPLTTDEYGVVFEIPLKALAEGLSFIVHQGDTKDLNNDQYLDFSVSGQEIWIVSGDDAVSNIFSHYTSFKDASFSQEYCGPAYVATIHYLRCDGDYGDYSSVDFLDYWGLHVWGDVVFETPWPNPLKASEINAAGAVFHVPLLNNASTVNFILHRGDEKDPGTDESLDIINTGDEIWLISGDLNGGNHVQHTSFTEAINSPGYCGSLSVATIHYHRCEGDYGNYNSNDYNNYWGLHLWAGALFPTDWPSPLKPSGFDEFGQVFEIPVVEMAANLNFIIHRGDEKDPGPDESLDIVNTGDEIWLVSGDVGSGPHTQYTSLKSATFSSFFCGVPIPTLSEWGMIILGFILIVGGVITLKQKRLYPRKIG